MIRDYARPPLRSDRCGHVLPRKAVECGAAGEVVVLTGFLALPACRQHVGHVALTWTVDYEGGAVEVTPLWSYEPDPEEGP